MPPNPYRRQPNINDMMYPKGSKQPRQVWAAVMNVPQPSSGNVVTPTPTPSNTPTGTPNPTTTLTSTPTQTSTPTTTLTSTPTPSPTTTLTSTPTQTPTTTTTLTTTPTTTPTPTATTPFNANAATYLNAVLLAGGTGITPTVSAATNTLFTQLTSAGLYSKLDVFYPMLGGTAASTSLNGSRASGTTFDIFWTGAMTFNSSGATGSATGAYGDTFYVPRTYADPRNYSFGYYIIGGNIGGGNGEVYPFGVYNAPYISNSYQNSGTNALGIYGWTVGFNLTELKTFSSWDGSYIGTFNSTPTKSIYKNYSNTGDRQVVSGTTEGTDLLPNLSNYLFVLNLNGAPYVGNYYSGRMVFAFMGDTLTPSEVQTIDGIINTFQTTLGRNIY